MGSEAATGLLREQLKHATDRADAAQQEAAALRAKAAEHGEGLCGVVVQTKHAYKTF